MNKSQLRYFLIEQGQYTRSALSDPSNRTLVGVALIGGLVSSLALGRLYARLTPTPEDDDLRKLASHGFIAVGTGVLTVAWYLSKARKQTLRETMLAATSDDAGDEPEA